eukprot:CAMPEP_0206269778 /NCGR_PEP_ID=MMETSP0047_2-20121206/32493_1 /ASSEMBLY_ACC=CAM_ASM_000192 /TAXON_ID=195065 /ORGANISM="Chroomonas mesostigmatica_cf, Strain CCMP1168" /LENGTH=46 /DNA_ID= /DNA_START= /DNA_END= /DNA_ORIENTATION=
MAGAEGGAPVAKYVPPNKRNQPAGDSGGGSRDGGDRGGDRGGGWGG